MKRKHRIATTMLAFTLTISAAAAESPLQARFREQFTALQDSELLEVNATLQSVLFDRNLPNGVRVPQGTYIIGEDIPAGTYRIEITDGSGFYDVRDKNGTLLYSGITGDAYDITEIGKIVLEEGYELKIVNSTFIFYAYTGIFH